MNIQDSVRLRALLDVARQAHLASGVADPEEVIVSAATVRLMAGRAGDDRLDLAVDDHVAEATHARVAEGLAFPR